MTVGLIVGAVLAVSATIGLEPLIRRVQSGPWRGAGITMLRRFAYAADEAIAHVTTALSNRAGKDFYLAVACLVEREDASSLRAISANLFAQTPNVAAAADHSAVAVSRSPYSQWTTRLYEQVARLDDLAQTLQTLPTLIENKRYSTGTTLRALNQQVAKADKLIFEIIEFNSDLKLRADIAEDDAAR